MQFAPVAQSQNSKANHENLNKALLEIIGQYEDGVNPKQVWERVVKEKELDVSRALVLSRLWALSTLGVINHKASKTETGVKRYYSVVL